MKFGEQLPPPGFQDETLIAVPKSDVWERAAQQEAEAERIRGDQLIDNDELAYRLLFCAAHGDPEAQAMIQTSISKLR